MTRHIQELLLCCGALPAWELCLEVLPADKLFWGSIKSLGDTEQLNLLKAIETR